MEIWDIIWDSMIPWLILGLRPANERRRYFVTTSLTGWVQAYNEPCYMNTAIGTWTWTEYPDTGVTDQNIMDKIRRPVEDCKDIQRDRGLLWAGPFLQKRILLDEYSRWVFITVECHPILLFHFQKGRNCPTRIKHMEKNTRLDHTGCTRGCRNDNPRCSQQI